MLKLMNNQSCFDFAENHCKEKIKKDSRMIAIKEIANIYPSFDNKALMIIPKTILFIDYTIQFFH